MSNKEEYGMFAKEVALHLDISVNTLRKWSLDLEAEGYEFERNNKGKEGQRIYYSRDILALTDFKKIVGKTNNLKNAAKAVASSAKDKENAEKMLRVLDDNDDKITFSKDEFQEYISKIVEETAAKTAEQVARKMDSVIEKRDRQLVNQLNQSMVEHRLEQLELAAAEENAPMTLWERIFGKKRNKAKNHNL